MTVPFTYNDGGRTAAGFRGTTNDCVCRAVAIVTGRPYTEVYSLINTYHKAKYRTVRRLGARAGVRKPDTRAIIAKFGLTWTPTMKVGQGCKVRLRPDELPSGRVIVALSSHVCAVVDGVVHDTHDPSRNGTRCVYGYWTLSNS